MSTASTPPAELTAGDTAQFAWTGGDYAASDGWDMSWRVVGAGVGVNLTAAPSGSDFSVSVAANAFAGLTIPERGIPCQLIGWATKAGARVTVYRGAVQLLPDPAALSVDLRGHGARMLEAVEALLENRATSDQMSYRIGDRELSRIPVPDLISLRDYYRRAARKEEDATARSLGQPRRPRRVLMQMGRA